MASWDLPASYGPPSDLAAVTGTVVVMMMRVVMMVPVAAICVGGGTDDDGGGCGDGYRHDGHDDGVIYDERRDSHACGGDAGLDDCDDDVE